MTTKTEERQLDTRLDLRRRIRIEHAHLMNFSDEFPALEGHPPGALHIILAHLADTMVDGINRIMLEGEGDGDDRNNSATEYVQSFMNVIGVEMFRLGQVTASSMPYERLTPCPCDVLTEDDLEELRP